MFGLVQIYGTARFNGRTAALIDCVDEHKAEKMI